MTSKKDVTKSKTRECEDCGDAIGADERRRRCPNCGQLVCGWCMNHVHGPAIHGPEAVIG